MPTVIVESVFDNPLTEGEHKTRGGRLFPCLDQHEVRWIHSYLSRDRRRMICRFEAADAESVRTAHRLANVRFRRVWSAHIETPEAAG